MLGQPDWGTDPRFATNPDRLQNREVLIALLMGETARRPVADLAAALDAVGVPVAPVQDMAQVATHPQTLATGMKRGGGALEFFGLPVRLDGQRPDRDDPAPALGADNGWLEELLSNKAG